MCEMNGIGFDFFVSVVRKCCVSCICVFANRQKTKFFSKFFLQRSCAVIFLSLRSKSFKSDVMSIIAEEEPDPVASENSFQAQQQNDPTTNSHIESLHTVIKKKKKKKKFDNDRNYRHVWSDDSDPSDSSDSSDSDADETEEEKEANGDRELRGNFDNTDKLVTKYLRDEKERLKLFLPEFIKILCFNFLFIPTDVIFHLYDPRVEPYVDITNEGKLAKISSRTVCIFSKDGYSSGHHIWHVKCHVFIIVKHWESVKNQMLNIDMVIIYLMSLLTIN